MASLTIENYVKAIFSICSQQDGQPASTGRVAKELGVSPGTVTSMLKTLADSELAEYTPYEGVALTESGRALALRVLRRHRLIEVFLVKTLQLSWDEVHEEAENMEHAVSDFLIDRIDQYLGFPETDPHGDPIPKPDGTLVDEDACGLDELAEGTHFRLVRVIDQSTAFLRYLTDNGLSLGTDGVVQTNSAQADIVTLQLADRQTTVSREIAKKLRARASH